MKINLVFCLLLTSFTVFSQNHFFGVKTGETRSKIITTFSEKSSRIEQVRGITYEYLLNDHFFVGSELTYDPQGISYIRTVLSLEEEVPIPFDFTIYSDYLSLPLKVGYRTKGRLYGYSHIAIVPSFMIRSYVNSLNFRNPIGINNGIGGFSFNTRRSNYLSKYVILGLVELGAGYEIFDRLHLLGTISFQRSLTSALDGRSASDGFQFDSQHFQGINLALGLKWAFVQNK